MNVSVLVRRRLLQMRKGLAKLRIFSRRVRAFRRLPRRSRQMFVFALLLNPMFRFTVKRRGIKSAAALAQRLGGNRPERTYPTPTIEIAREVVLGVRAAAGALPIEVVCLPRSLSSWTLLRRAGIGSSLLIGWDSAVNKQMAHAWVDVADEAVGENPEHIAQLATFHAPILKPILKPILESS